MGNVETLEIRSQLMTATSWSYEAFVFRQRDRAPLLVSFVAPAAEILAWTGVPRKSDELLTGYQRFRDKARIDNEIVPFFQNAQNCSPTAIILALRRKSALGACRLDMKDAEGRAILPASIKPGQVVRATLVVDFECKDIESAFLAASTFISQRLVNSPDSEGDESGEVTADADDQDDSTTDSTEDSDEEAIHLGTETLRRMQTLVEEKANWSKPAFQEAITDYSKPAFLIDGQHRVTAGSKIGDRGLNFMVCGLYDAAWEEQVFQFTVVNLKPKRIPPALITSIAALSLTAVEQEAVNIRLDNAGVNMDEVQIMSLLAYDGRSPFCEAIDMAVGDRRESSEKLGYGSMKRLAKVWYSARRESLTQIAKSLSKTNSTREALDSWRENQHWFTFLAAMWDVVRKHYSESLWRKGTNRLFIGAHLWALQEVILQQADGQMPSHWRTPEELDGEERYRFVLGKLLEVVSVTISYFPEELWNHAWAKASQDTGPGRDELVNLFEKFVEQGKKHRVWRNWKSDPWFDTTDRTN